MVPDKEKEDCICCQQQQNSNAPTIYILHLFFRAFSFLIFRSIIIYSNNSTLSSLYFLKSRFILWIEVTKLSKSPVYDVYLALPVEIKFQLPPLSVWICLSDKQYFFLATNHFLFLPPYETGCIICNSFESITSSTQHSKEFVS